MSLPSARLSALSVLICLICAFLAPGELAMAAPSDVTTPASDTVPDGRSVPPPATLDTLRTFPNFKSLKEWEARRKMIREQILVSCGLYPLPNKTPLHAHVFGRVERDGYTIEKVYFQTYPGFYLAGNLYRPLHHAASAEVGGHEARHPAVLITHGHWTDGRMADGPDGSIAARAITFAREGYVAFTYDMVGFNDTHQIDHKFAYDPQHWLWGISLMGLQTWNSIRAIDFISSLHDVDTTRLAITGESGGGTQTMMLGATDDRLAAVGPCVMVSHSMQGGCICENAPGLRIDFSNMEIAAAAAPRPQIMVAATGDWTRTMMTIEGPAVESIYKLYGKPNNLKYTIFNYGHNINKTSREAVYAYFGEHLLHGSMPTTFQEPPYQREAVADLRVFPDGAPLPADAKTADQLTADLIALGKSDLERHKPHDSHSLTAFKQIYTTAWERTLSLETPDVSESKVQAGEPNKGEGYLSRTFVLDRGLHAGKLTVQLFTPQVIKPDANGVVLVDPRGQSAFIDPATCHPGELVRKILQSGRPVLLLDAFLTGAEADPKVEELRKPFNNFFTTYNRTDLQERVQDLAIACAFMKSNRVKSTDDGNHTNVSASVTLVGQGKAGLWALLAAPAADAVAADCAQLDLTTDAALLTDDLFTPCLRRLGDFSTAATLAAPHPLLLHNTGAAFSAVRWIEDVYKATRADNALVIDAQPISSSTLLNWIIAH